MPRAAFSSMNRPKPNPIAMSTPVSEKFIAWNGDVYLCCMTNGRMDALGNAGLQSLEEIFQGEPYKRVRRSFLAGQHLKPCHRCDLFLAENARLHAALGEEGAFRDTPAARVPA